MRLIRWIGFAAAFVALIAATAWLLYEYAQWQVTAYLREQAAHALVLAARAETPYRWRFDSGESLVAGRVFNARDFAFRDGELVVQSSGDTFEIGLPLARPVDLLLFPHLQIVADADGAAAIRAVVRETLESSEQVIAESSLVPGTSAVLDLASAMPSRVAMLRLRVAAPPGTTVHLRSATLSRAEDAPRVDLEQPPHLVDFGAPTAGGNPIYRLPLHEDLLEIDVAAMAKRADASLQPLILLPQHARIEQQIGLRNAVYKALPGAILIPERAIDATFAQAREEVAQEPDRSDFMLVRWAVLAIYGIALIWSRARPAKSPRLRALTEAVLAQAGPLWLILFERFDGKPDALQWLLIAVSVLYAISLSVPRQWRWNGGPRTWLPAIGIIVLAAAAGFALHQPNPVSAHAIGVGYVARYAAWALVQQYLVCAVCTDRWRIVTGNSAAAAYLGAVGFALMHTPNAALMLATLLGGLCWCSLYLRERALLPLAVSHAASALVLLALLPRSLLASAEVSARFFQ